MEEFAFQRYPQNPTEHPYKPTYPPQGNPGAPVGQDHNANGGPGGDPYAFGSGYGGSRGGGLMRGGPRGAPTRGRTPYTRGRGGRGYPPSGPGGLNRNYAGDKGQYNERDDWGGWSGSSAPSQPYNQLPQQQTPHGGTIVIRNLPTHVTEQDLFNHFGSAGMIKMDGRTGLPQVWLGPQAGEARISFQDPQVAANAVQWYNNGDFQGNMIHVEMARMDPPSAPSPMAPPPGGMGGRGGPSGRGERFQSPRGGYGGMRGGPSRGREDYGRASFEKRDGDWICANPDCQNTNFKWRGQCNRCKAPRPGSDEEYPGDMNGNEGGGSRGMRSRGYPPSGGRGMGRGGMRGFGAGGMGSPHSGMMGRGGMSRGGGPGSMRGQRGGGMSDRGFRARGGYPQRRGNDGNWRGGRGRPY